MANLLYHNMDSVMARIFIWTNTVQQYEFPYRKF